jgi:hypothetical protein
MSEEEKPEPDIVCPHCSKGFYCNIAAHVPNSQKVLFRIQFEGKKLSAKTLHSTIANAEKCLVMVAKDVGVKVHVFIDSLECKEGEVTVVFLVARAQPTSAGRGEPDDS